MSISLPAEPNGRRTRRSTASPGFNRLIARLNLGLFKGADPPAVSTMSSTRNPSRSAGLLPST